MFDIGSVLKEVNEFVELFERSDERKRIALVKKRARLIRRYNKLVKKGKLTQDQADGLINSLLNI